MKLRREMQLQSTKIKCPIYSANRCQIVQANKQVLPLLVVLPTGHLAETDNYDEEKDDAVKSKNPRVLGKQQIASEDSTAAEDIGSDFGTERTEDESPQYTGPSEDSEIEFIERTQGTGVHQERVSRSVELNTSLVRRA